MSCPNQEKKAVAVQVKAEPSGEFVVRFATKRNARGELVVDKDGDVYADGAIGEQPIHIGCWNHGSCSGPAGTGKTFETASDIRAKGRLLMDTTAGREEFARWKALGDQAQFSYVFQVKDQDHVQVAGKRVRRLKALEVVSVDLVARGAGIDTGIVELKGGCGCGEAVDVVAEFERFKALRRASLEAERDRFKAITAPYIAAAVSENYHAVARAAVQEAAAAAKIPVPTVKFFRNRPWANHRLQGFSSKSGVWLSADLTPAQLRFIAAHETAHVAGHDERSAERFAEVVTGRRYSELT